MSFPSFKFHPAVKAGLSAAGYNEPTPIQAQAIPQVMAGGDITGLAQTGTGKTAAFALPILHRLMKGKRGTTRALVIAPTRELAGQISASFALLGSKTGLKSTAVYGGVAMGPQIAAIRRADIIVACPGRLLDHIGRKTLDLSAVEVLVLDEADHMFDMGFLPDIRRILKTVPEKRQTLLFSATMPPEIRELAEESLKQPATVQVGTAAAADTVSHALFPVARNQKTPLLMRLLHQTLIESVLIFTRTKHRAERLGEKLCRAGYRAASLQGNLSQNRRQSAINGFRDGTYQILVATDIAARGIDITNVSHVINYDIPGTPDAYIHRIGRTGRAERTGDAFTLVTEEDNAMVRAINRLVGTEIERRTISDFDYKTTAPAGATLRKPGKEKPRSRKKAGSAPVVPKNRGSLGAARKPGTKQSAFPFLGAGGKTGSPR
jgi:ATP-dependent RNA helicase RhlE